MSVPRPELPSSIIYELTWICSTPFTVTTPSSTARLPYSVPRHPGHPQLCGAHPGLIVLHLTMHSQPTAHNPHTTHSPQSTDSSQLITYNPTTHNPQLTIPTHSSQPTDNTQPHNSQHQLIIHNSQPATHTP